MFRRRLHGSSVPEAVGFPALLRLLLLLSIAVPAQAQEETRVDVGSYNLRTPTTEKSLRPQSNPHAISAPVITTIAPDSARSSQSMALPDRKGAIEQMLQSHEFSFGNRRSQLKEGGALNSGVDLDSVKLRVSRNKILVKAEFLFN